MRRLFRPLLALTMALAVFGSAFHFGTPLPVGAQVGNPNNLIIEGAPIGNPPQLRSFGLDTSVGMTFTTQGNGDITLTPGGTGSIVLNGPVSVLGPIVPTQPTTTHVAVLAALENCRSDNALLIPLRVAANDWALARTAGGAETYNIHCQIPLPWQTTAGNGARLDGFTIIQQVLVADLTSNTFNDLATVTYANNAANVLADYGGVVTITPPVVVQANPYVTIGALGTPAFMNLGATAVNIDFTVVLQNTGQYRLYGIGLNYSTLGN